MTKVLKGGIKNKTIFDFKFQLMSKRKLTAEKKRLLATTIADADG